MASARCVINYCTYFISDQEGHSDGAARPQDPGNAPTLLNYRACARGWSRFSAEFDDFEWLVWSVIDYTERARRWRCSWGRRWHFHYWRFHYGWTRGRRRIRSVVGVHRSTGVPPRPIKTVAKAK